MKRLLEGKLYIQISDIIFLLSGKYMIPNGLKEYLFTNYKAIDNSKLGNEFACFECQDDISYLNELTFITDYDVYKNVSIDILEDIIDDITCRKNQMELRINNMRKPNRELIEDYKITTLKATDISNIYLYRMGKIKLYIPGEKYEPSLIKKFKYTFEKKKQNKKL